MDAVALIGLWAALFLITHLGISSAAIRSRLAAAIGEQPYRGVYSIVSLATFVPLVIVFAHHKHAGPMLWNLRAVPPLRWLAWLMMLAAFVLFVAGLAGPNPSSMAGRLGGFSARGVLKLTRHPSFTAFALFGFAHMMMNGFVGDLLFFATFPALGILGGLHQDRRKLRDLGDSYRGFVVRTSFFPGAALWDGRQRWTGADTPWLAIGIGVAVTVLIVMLHPTLFGGHPIP
ncbi:MAG: NnrU family protein [Candidatus Binataceae bacterium]